MHWRNGIREIFQEMKGPNLVYPELKSLEPAIGGFQILTYIQSVLMAAKIHAPKTKNVSTNFSNSQITCKFRACLLHVSNNLMTLPGHNTWWGRLQIIDYLFYLSCFMWTQLIKHRKFILKQSFEEPNELYLVYDIVNCKL